VSYKKGRRRSTKEARVAALRQLPDSTWGRLARHRQHLLQLETGIQGKVVFPFDPDYEADRQESNPAFQAYPQVIVYCEVVSDVSQCLYAASATGWPVACRSGGHSTAGYSVNDGFVIDTSCLNGVSVDMSTMTAVVGAGTNFARLNAVLDAYQVHVPTGECGDVCVAGFMQGGGYGYTSRAYGMNLDSVLAMTVMLADGSIITASPVVNNDLYWAMRGGTGGNFGVLLDITYRVYDLWQVWGWTLQWPIDVGPQVMAAFQQRFMKTGDPRLGYMGNIGVDPQNDQVVVVQGIFAGDRIEGLSVLQPLMKINGAELLVDYTASYADVDNYLANNPYPIPNVPDSGTKEIKQAGYIDRMLTLEEWTSVISYYRDGPPAAYDTAIFEPYGGAINSVSPNATAFIHRACDMNFFVDAFWVEDADEAAAVKWLDGYMAVMAPLTNGHCYQNYPRRGLSDYQWMFWGPALGTLVRIREKYDPAHFFQYPQCVQPYGGPPSPRADQSFSGPAVPAEIVYQRRH
jgi:FAD/FMN-containing dehydrogenase